MALPARLTFHNCKYLVDGGTYILCATDERDTVHQVTLVQHMFLQPHSDPQRIPGRLYFDEELVAIRSERESELLRLIKTAAVQATPPAANASALPGITIHAVAGDDIKRFLDQAPEENVRWATDALVTFVESEEYVTLSVMMGGTRDVV